MAEIPTLNVELLDKVMEKVRKEPEHHNQNTWIEKLVRAEKPLKFEGLDLPVQAISCGTVGCIAGWAATIAGGTWLASATLVPLADDEAEAEDYEEFLAALRDTPDMEDRRYIEGTQPAFRAERLLGITSGEARYLFSGARSIAQIEAFVALLKEHATDGQRAGRLNPGWYWYEDYIYAEEWPRDAY